MDMNVLQRGERVLNLRIDQKKEGVILAVKAHPMVEEFFKGLTGVEQRLDGQGNGLWYPVSDPDQKMYKLSGARGSFTNLYYTFEYPGYSLNGDEVGLNHTCANLSFLRLVGIGSEDGVTFGIKSVMSLSGRREFRDMVHMSMKKFVRDFLVPVTLELEIKVEDRIHV